MAAHWAPTDARRSPIPQCHRPARRGRAPRRQGRREGAIARPCAPRASPPGPRRPCRPPERLPRRSGRQLRPRAPAGACLRARRAERARARCAAPVRAAPASGALPRPPPPPADGPRPPRPTPLPRAGAPQRRRAGVQVPEGPLARDRRRPGRVGRPAGHHPRPPDGRLPVPGRPGHGRHPQRGALLLRLPEPGAVGRDGGRLDISGPTAVGACAARATAPFLQARAPPAPSSASRPCPRRRLAGLRRNSLTGPPLPKTQAARNFNNIEDGFYISPAFLDKITIHIAKVGAGGSPGAAAAAPPRGPHAPGAARRQGAPGGRARAGPAPARRSPLARLPRPRPPPPPSPTPTPPPPHPRTSWTSPRSRCPSSWASGAARARARPSSAASRSRSWASAPS
jgi:hypothetical protein